MKPRHAGRNRGLLAVHSGALGDVILFGRLLEMTPGPRTLIASGQKASLLKTAGVVQETLDFDLLPMHEVFSSTPLDQCRLAGMLGGFDRLVSCLGGGGDEPSQRLSSLCGCAQATFLPVRPPARYDGHLVSLWLEMLGVAGGGDPPGSHARAFAEIVAAGVLAGELSLLGALAAQHLARAHQDHGRG